jgi:hypothetical protein
MSRVSKAPRFRTTYDRASDVLYVTRRPGPAARSREENPGLVWRYDSDRSHLIGLTIVDFDRYWGVAEVN